MKKLGILGCGVVGRGVLEQLRQREAQIGENMQVEWVLDRHPERVPEEFRHLVVSELPWNVRADLAVECLGGVDSAYIHTKRLLKGGTSVVSSNKAVVAEKGAELLKTAREQKVQYLFDASVGGEIPIITDLLHQQNRGNPPARLRAILNGTCNYILTKMGDGLTFDIALANAQQEGFAEKDPTDDIKGIDTARKLAIIASIVRGEMVDYRDIPTVGIDGVTPEDIAAAKKANAEIKLLATADFADGTLSVRPEQVSAQTEIGSTNLSSNIAEIVWSNGFTHWQKGRGAGGEATANSIWADISKILKNEAIMPNISEKRIKTNIILNKSL